MTSALIARAKGGRVNLFSWVKWLLTALGEKGVEKTGRGKHWNELLPLFATSKEILHPQPQPPPGRRVTQCLRHSIQNWLQEHYWRVLRPPISCNSRVASNYVVTLPGRQHTEGHDINCKKLLLRSVSFERGCWLFKATRTIWEPGAP